MNTQGMKKVGTFVPDNLIAGNRHPVDVMHVVIKEGQKLKRGTVLEADSTEPEKYVILGTAAAASVPDGTEEQEAVENGTEANPVAVPEAEYILAEDVDASEVDVVGTAYYAGEFAENFLLVKEGYSITDRDRRILRNAGIFLKGIVV